MLLDLSLPDGDGRDICRQLRRDSDVPIIMVTASGTRDRPRRRARARRRRLRRQAVRDRRGGRADPRRAPPRPRASSEDPPRFISSDLRIDLGARRVWLADRELELTRKEFDLLARLARDAGRVVTRETLMSDVWDLNWFGSTKTLDVHIAWLRRKLGDDPSDPTYIHTVRGVGFRLADAEERRRERRVRVCGSACWRR